MKRGEITADATEPLHPQLSVQTSRDLLLYLEHAQIALSLIVIKRNGEIIEEDQHQLLVERHIEDLRDS